MTRKLNEPDRQAVDLVLDRLASTRQDGVIAMSAPAEPRVESVEKILNVLAAMPAAEPPGDLVTRALKRIEQMSQESGEARGIPPYLDQGQLPA